MTMSYEFSSRLERLSERPSASERKAVMKLMRIAIVIFVIALIMSFAAVAVGYLR